MKKNKSNKKILLIVVIAAVLLVGVMLLLIFLPDGESSDATYDEGTAMSTSTDSDGIHQAVVQTDKNGEIANNSYGTLLEYVPADISKIHVENLSGTYDVTSYTPVDEDGNSDTTEYTLVGYEDFELKTGAPDEIANDAAALDFTKVISLDGKNSSDYGFDEPVATVTVTYSDDTEAIIVVGADAVQGAGTYVKFGTSDTIYLVETDAVDAFSYSLTDLISLTINDSASDTDSSQASSIVLSGSHLSKQIEIVPNTNENNSASYMITTPVEGFASETGSSLVEGAIRGLYADSVKMLNPSSDQLSKLGLSTPYAEVKAVYSDITVDLISSEPDSEGNVCIMEKGGKVVYQMASANLPWVTITFDDMLNEYVLYPKMTALSSMTVNDGSKTYSYSLSSTTSTTTDDSGSETTSTTTTVNYGDSEIELGYFSTFYQNIAMITRADSDTESFGSSPVFSVTYSYESGGSDTVAYYNTGDNRYLAVVNGTAVGHVYKSGINKLINQSATIANNEQVDSIN
jgi:hypothetical protein